MPVKSDSSSDFVQWVAQLEERSDRCFEALRIYDLPRGLAAWGVLTYLVGRTEDHRAKQGFRNYDAALIALSRVGTLILRWIRERGKDERYEVSRYSWTNPVREAVNEAWDVAFHYHVFLDAFPMWHQDRMLAEREGTTIRFRVPGGEGGRRVSAFQKGFRPVQSKALDDGLKLDERQRSEMDAAIRICLDAGHLRMHYGEPAELYQLLMPAFVKRLTALFRRGDGIDIGPYTVGDLKLAYAALTTVFSVHEHLCFTFGRSYRYPLNSCTMVRSVGEWTDLISRLSRLDEGRCAAIVRDLTLDDRYWNLHVQPFVEVDDGMLAVAPQFPLHSRADENVLRICGHVRPSYFAEAGRLKEQEMHEDLVPNVPGRFSPQHRVRLPNPLPDIDLLLADEESGCVFIAELKWIRKPLDWRERINREEDFRKGIDQLLEIRAYLQSEPGHLRDSGKLPRSISDYQQLTYVLIARDNFSWTDSTEVVVADYEVFKGEVARTESLRELSSRLTQYGWLPIENRDFLVKDEAVTASGVRIETEVFYMLARIEKRGFLIGRRQCD